MNISVNIFIYDYVYYFSEIASFLLTYFKIIVAGFSFPYLGLLTTFDILFVNYFGEKC